MTVKFLTGAWREQRGGKASTAIKHQSINQASINQASINQASIKHQPAGAHAGQGQVLGRCLTQPHASQL
jgi:hypothetical protein